MTFDEWLGDKHLGSMELEFSKDAFVAGAASRDAYIERLETGLLQVRKALCGDIHNTDDLLDLIASRDAEVAELKKDAADFHGQVNRLTEFNNNLVSHRDELKSELFDLTKQRDALSRMADSLEQERDQLREHVKLLQSTIKNLRDVKGRHHSEIAYKWLIEALAATEPKA